MCVCVYVGMCGFCNVWVCVYVCVGFVMCVCVCVCMCGFCNVWVCVCVGFLMCVCVGVFVYVCVLEFTVLYCLYCVF